MKRFDYERFKPAYSVCSTNLNDVPHGLTTGKLPFGEGIQVVDVGGTEPGLNGDCAGKSCLWPPLVPVAANDSDLMRFSDGPLPA